MHSTRCIYIMLFAMPVICNGRAIIDNYEQNEGTFLDADFEDNADESSGLEDEEGSDPTAILPTATAISRKAAVELPTIIKIAKTNIPKIANIKEVSPKIPAAVQKQPTTTPPKKETSLHGSKSRIAAELNAIKKSVRKLEEQLRIIKRPSTREWKPVTEPSATVKLPEEVVVVSPSSTDVDPLSVGSPTDKEEESGKGNVENNEGLVDEKLVGAIKKSLGILQKALLSHQKNGLSKETDKPAEEEHELVKKVERKDESAVITPTKRIPTGRQSGNEGQPGKKAFSRLLETVNKTIEMLNSALPKKGSAQSAVKEVTSEETRLDEAASFKRFVHGTYRPGIYRGR